jgi:hypothetical protein
MLVEAGVLRREPYQEPGARVRQEYRPTGMGLSLYPMLVAVGEWGDRHLADPAGPPLEFAHRGCDELVHAELHCAAGHRVTDNRDVVSRPGPGAHRR